MPAAVWRWSESLGRLGILFLSSVTLLPVPCLPSAFPMFFHYVIRVLFLTPTLPLSAVKYLFLANAYGFPNFCCSCVSGHCCCQHFADTVTSIQRHFAATAALAQLEEQLHKEDGEGMVSELCWLLTFLTANNPKCCAELIEKGYVSCTHASIRTGGIYYGSMYIYLYTYIYHTHICIYINTHTYTHT